MLSIPKEICSRLGWRKGEEFVVVLDGNKAVIIRQSDILSEVNGGVL
jgi:AbrB family looped-hinge helix DNA binding protein